MRVFLSACGEGFGHISRMLALYRAIESMGDEAIIATYGMALERAQKERVNWFKTLPEIRMVGADGRFDMLRSIVRSSGTPLDVMKAFIMEWKYIKDMDVVVSDSRLSTVLAGAQARKPTFYITNQTRFRLPKELSEDRKTRVVKLLEKAMMRRDIIEKMINVPLSIPYGFVDMILIPDFKPPNTICLPLLSRDYEIKKKTYFIGPLSLALRDIQPVEWKGRRKVLVLLGGQTLRKGLFRRVVRMARRMKGWSFLVSSIFVRKGRNVGSVKVRRFLHDVYPYMASADVLIIPAGHSSIMESILMAKPSIVIPDKGQGEQESNARRYEELGLGRMLSVDGMKEMPSLLEELFNNKETYEKPLIRLSKRARRSENGSLNAARMISSFIKRISY